MNRTKHTYFKVCEYCGANLDPGEECDCRKVSQTAQNAFKRTKASRVIFYPMTARKPLRRDVRTI